jgi:hypothetical protein
MMNILEHDIDLPDELLFSETVGSGGCGVLERSPACETCGQKFNYITTTPGMNPDTLLDGNVEVLCRGRGWLHYTVEEKHILYDRRPGEADRGKVGRTAVRRGE